MAIAIGLWRRPPGGYDAEVALMTHRTVRAAPFGGPVPRPA